MNDRNNKGDGRKGPGENFNGRPREDRRGNADNRGGPNRGTGQNQGRKSFHQDNHGNRGTRQQGNGNRNNHFGNGHHNKNQHGRDTHLGNNRAHRNMTYQRNSFNRGRNTTSNRNDTQSNGYKKELCRYYLRGQCKFNSVTCRYDHSREECKFFREGRCRYGNVCKNVHSERREKKTEILNSQWKGSSQHTNQTQMKEEIEKLSREVERLKRNEARETNSSDKRCANDKYMGFIEFMNSFMGARN